jgi:hypothetical protein
MNRNKYKKKNCFAKFKFEHIILKFYYKIFKCFYGIKNSIFYETITTVFQFTQRAIKNCSVCHAWNACRKLSTPGIRENIDYLTATSLRGLTKI